MNHDLPVAVRRATTGDAAAAATLHVDAISEGFLATLGADFLTRVYMRLSRSEHGALWVAVSDPRRPVADAATTGEPEALPVVAGFVALAHDTSRFYRQFLVRDGAAALLRNFVPVVRSLPRTFETLRYGLGRDGPGRDGLGRDGLGRDSFGRDSFGRDRGELPRAEILALAVDHRCLRRGVARALLGTVTEHLVARGIDAARVVTTVDNVSAHAAYAAAGFAPHHRTEVHRGVSQDVLVWRG